MLLQANESLYEKRKQFFTKERGETYRPYIEISYRMPVWIAPGKQAINKTMLSMKIAPVKSGAFKNVTGMKIAAVKGGPFKTVF